METPGINTHNNNRITKKTIASNCFFLIAWLMVFTSCKQRDNPSKHTKTAFNKDSSIEIKLRPVQKDETKQYLYTTINKSRIEQEINDEEMVIENNIDVSMQYDVSRDSIGNFLFQITFKEFKVKIKAGDIEKELKAATAAGSFDAQERIFAAFDKATLTVMVTSDGKVLSISGLDHIQNKMYELAKGNADAKKMIQTSLQQYLIPENFKTTFEQTFKVFPANRVKIGYQWKSNEIAISDMKINVPLVYTLNDIKDNYGIIGVEGKINFENQQVQVQASVVNYTLKGEQNGEIKVDLSTGMISSSETHFKAKGMMVVFDNEVPVMMETKTIIKGERVK